MNLNELKFMRSNNLVNDDQNIDLLNDCNRSIRSMMLVSMSHLIGISCDILEETVIKPKKNISFKKKLVLDTFLKNIDLIIFDKKTNDKIKNMIFFIVNYGNFKINNNRFYGEYTSKDNRTYTLKILVDKSKVTYKSFDGKINSEGIFNLNYSGSSYLNITDSILNVYELKDKNLHSSKCTNIIETFDRNKIQQFGYKQTKYQSYYIMHDTNLKLLTKPDIFDNYVEKEYCWRKENNYIIKRYLKEYLNYDMHRNVDSMLIGINNCPNEARLPKGGYFVWYDPELDEKYKIGECSIDDVWKNKGNVYKKKYKNNN